MDKEASLWDSNEGEEDEEEGSGFVQSGEKGLTGGWLGLNLEGCGEDRTLMALSKEKRSKTSE